MRLEACLSVEEWSDARTAVAAAVAAALVESAALDKRLLCMWVVVHVDTGLVVVVRSVCTEDREASAHDDEESACERVEAVGTMTGRLTLYSMDDDESSCCKSASGLEQRA